MTYLVLDIETGGLDARFHDLLSMHLAVCNAELVIIEELGLKLRPADNRFRVTAQAMQINGIDLRAHQQVAITAPEGARQVQALLAKYKSLVCVGHNVTFDLRFIHTQLIPQMEWERYFGYWKIDTLEMARSLAKRGVIGLNKFSLSDMASYFNVSIVGRHDARNDVMITLECLRRMSQLNTPHLPGVPV